MKKLLLILVHSVLWRTIFKLVIGLRFYNRDILKKSKQYILISNHNSHLDSMAIMSAIPANNVHTVHPIAAEDFFGDRSVKEFLMVHFVNAILIPRRRAKNPGEADPIDMMSNLLQRGHSIILYPEGTRGEPGVMQDFKKGLALVASKHPEVDVIPIFIDGLHRTMPKGFSLILPYNCKLIVGEPIVFESNEIDDILKASETAIRDLEPESDPI
jgi:1-acyl-sn-glycerol-3-phosphate acyltransferase